MAAGAGGFRVVAVVAAVVAAACRVVVLGTGGFIERRWHREERGGSGSDPAVEGIVLLIFRQEVVGQGGVVRIPGERVDDGGLTCTRDLFVVYVGSD